MKIGLFLRQKLVKDIIYDENSDDDELNFLLQWNVNGYYTHLNEIKFLMY